MTTVASPLVKQFLTQVRIPEPNSHKGQNGKLLIIGGSELFHAASKWSLDIASRFVDMVFYSSLPQNNQLILEAKQNFWNGIVVAREEIDDYMAEADAVLIGPGMERSQETADLTNSLLQKYPDKKWVIDAGALQMLDLAVLSAGAILTPHQEEWRKLQDKGFDLANHPGVVVLAKDVVDTISYSKEVAAARSLPPEIAISGGNPGMTKGGTGDVLAGLVAALYTGQDAITAAVVASYVNKYAADNLYTKVGPYFNASDLVAEIPSSFWQLISELKLE